MLGWVGLVWVGLARTHALAHAGAHAGTRTDSHVFVDQVD